MITTCKMMVPTQPGVGDADRHPPPHQCKRPVYADGYCARHSKRYQESKARQADLDARYKERAKAQPIDPIDAAIALLVKNGYRVEKLQLNAEVGRSGKQ